MKLKKIASLALAGVMAVSMLAACGDKTGTTEDGATVTTTSSSVVTAFNDGQDADNKVKVTFTSDATLDAALQKAVALRGDQLGTTGEAGAIKSEIVALTGKYGTVDQNGVGTATADTAFDTKGTEAVTVLYANNYDSSSYWTEADALAAAARDADDVIAKLVASTKEGTPINGDYYDYTYTGTASVAKVERADGTTTYCVAYTITRTGVKTKLEV